MNITNLKLENFLSFKDLDLDIGGINVIQGENLDDDGQQSNGTGKSALQSGIEFALFASTSRGVTSTELVKWGEKKGYVALTLHCPVRKEEMVIERTIGRGGKLYININSEPLDFANVNDGNRQIIDWIGISREDIQNYYLINKVKYESFYTSSNRKKLEMIGRFSNLSLLDSSDKQVQIMADEVQSEIDQLNADNFRSRGRIEKTEELIEAEKGRDFDAEYKENINSFNDSIAKELENQEHYSETIDINLKAIETLQIHLDKQSADYEYFSDLGDTYIVPEIALKVEEYEESIKDIRGLIDSLQESDMEAHELRQECIIDKRSAEVMVAGTIECPKCEHEFNPTDPSVDLVAEADAIKNLEDAIELCNDNIKSIKEEISEKNGIINSIKEDIDTEVEKRNKISRAKSDNQRVVHRIGSEVSKTEADIERKKLSIDNLNGKINFSKDRVLEFNKAKKSLKKGSFQASTIKGMKKDILEEEEKITYNVNVISELEQLKYNVMQWKFNFKLFKSQMSMEVLNIITGYTNKVLVELGSSLQVKWEGFKVKSNGDLSDKITPLIIRNGEAHSFGNYSGGERGRLEYASILANQYLINSTHAFGGLNFLSTDEITEGIDELGLYDLTKALINTEKTILLTTHVVNTSTAGNVLLVRKQNGCSVVIDTK